MRLTKNHNSQTSHNSPPLARRKTSTASDRDTPLRQTNNHPAILEHLPVFVYLLTREYTFSYVNSCFRKEFGIPDEHTRCYSIMRKSHEPCANCPAMDVFTDKQNRVWQWTDNLRGNSYQIHDIPYGNIDETALVLGVGINITQSAQAEKNCKESSSKEEFLRICCYCNKIHNKIGQWQRVEAYFAEEQDIRFSHSICPQCMHIHYPEIQMEID